MTLRLGHISQPLCCSDSPSPERQTRAPTWEATVHHALLLSAAALHVSAHDLSATALLAAAIVERPGTADLVSGARVRHSATAGVADARGHPVVLLIWTAYFTCQFRTVTTTA